MSEKLPFLFHRHDLLMVDPDAELNTDAPVVRKYLRDGLPVVVRRPATNHEGVHCGIAIPGHKRFGFTVSRNAVRQIIKRPCAADLSLDLPGNPEVFGSYAWEYLTGVQYRHENSDIDLIYRISDLDDLPRNLPENCDAEIILPNGEGFSLREFNDDNSNILIKTDYDVYLTPKYYLTGENIDSGLIAAYAVNALREELFTYPKPGLVSMVDSGSHRDMDANHFMAAIKVLGPFFKQAAEAGSRTAGFAELIQIGIAAEQAMLNATGGVNTHRGAIFILGLLSAAAGYKLQHGGDLGEIVRKLWAEDIRQTVNPGSHGSEMQQRYGCGGAKTEAAAGFPTIYRYGLPVFTHQLPRNEVRVKCFFAMLPYVDDSTLLRRGGIEGRDFARDMAWNFDYADAERIHRQFVARNLSCGGVADLLAATIFIKSMEGLKWPV